jgi:TorA maturation chaperone TorD
LSSLRGRDEKKRRGCAWMSGDAYPVGKPIAVALNPLTVSELVPPPEQQERADLYGLLAALLLGPDEALIAALAALPRSDASDDTFAQGWDALLAAARRCGGSQALAEFDSLFVAAGTPSLNPYQCYYLDGWLMDKPLAQLREELRALGLQRAPGATELEDHLGALCETMRVLIESGRPPETQQAFFERHLAGWSARCLQDIAGAAGADFYRAVAAFAQAFFELEATHAEAFS